MMILSDDIKQFIEKNKDVDIHQLLLSKHNLPNDKLKFAVQQIEGRQRIQYKLPSWYVLPDIVYPVHLSLEQCSSEATASYKSSLISGESLVDLTGGYGIDTTLFAQNFQKLIYVEQNRELAEIVTHNFGVFGLNNVQVIIGRAEHVLEGMDAVDQIFIDPARRDIGGGKLVSITDCVPDVTKMQEEFKKKAKGAMIKLSPMLDLKQALRELDNVSEVHIVALNNECKELLMITNYADNGVSEPTIYCTNLLANHKDIYQFRLSEEEDLNIDYVSKLDQYLYEPNVALLKAGAYSSISRSFNLKKLHPNTHLYTSNEKCVNFPGRKFKIEEIFNFNKKSIKQLKASVSKANITIRNFPSSVDDLRKKLKMSDGGDMYLFATTLSKNEKVLVLCSKI